MKNKNKKLNENSESQRQKDRSSFVRPVSSIIPNDQFYESFTNNFSYSKNITEKIQDTQVDLDRKKLEGTSNNKIISKHYY